MVVSRLRPARPVNVRLVSFWFTLFTFCGFPAGEARAFPPPLLGSAHPAGVRVGTLSTVRLLGDHLSQTTAIVTGRDEIRVESFDSIDEDLVVQIRVTEGAVPGFQEVRAIGPLGWSNALTLRVDRLEGRAEREPNDRPESADVMTLETARSGTLCPGDVDWYLLQGPAGTTTTVEVESRRLGVPIAPVLTLTDLVGRPIAQGEPAPGLRGDPRCTVTIPADGTCRIEVRDLLYRGGPHVVYRLRVTDEPYATGLAPLGGRVGGEVTLEARGGNLPVPARLRWNAKGNPGTTIVPPLFGEEGERFAPPGRLRIGDSPEQAEDTVVPPTGFVSPATLNGGIDRPGESDRWDLNVKAGEPLTLQVEAAVLGSWLDPVLRVFDGSGQPLAENDDAPSLLSPPDRINQPSRDSRIDLTPIRDGRITVEITDRFGRGGAGYAYRLTVGPPPLDFAVVAQPRESVGAINLVLGTETRLPFRVYTDGRLSAVVLQAEGLPPGVVCEPVVVRSRRGSSRGASTFAEATGSLRLRVDGDGPLSVDYEGVRVVGSARLGGRGEVRRVAEVAVTAPSWDLAPPIRPVVNRRSTLPVALIPGEAGATP